MNDRIFNPLADERHDYHEPHFSGNGASALLPGAVDLGALIAAGLPREVPSVGHAFGDKSLLYAGRINEIHGEPGLGKTNVSCAFAVSVIRDGGEVLFIDPEDTPAGIASRLAAFGLSAQEVTQRFHYLQNPEPSTYRQIQEWNSVRRCSLVICDGLAEMLTQEGLSEDLPREVLPFFKRTIRPFTEANSAVLISDHVIKSTENRGLWPRGSGAKMGRYDGAVYILDEITPYSPDQAGAIRLRVAKDRLGGVGLKGHAAAELHFTPITAGTQIEWKAPADKTEFVPTVLMERISRHLVVNPNATTRDLRKLGNADYVDHAILKLREFDHISIEPQGKGKQTIYRLLNPFTGVIV